DGARRDHVDRGDRVGPELHDRARPELLLDRGDRGGHRLATLRLSAVLRSIVPVPLVRGPLSRQRHGSVTLLSNGPGPTGRAPGRDLGRSTLVGVFLANRLLLARL